jgi:predicted permease
MTDIQEATRQLKKAPGFTTTAVITLALGIGATTAIFTLVHQVMLKTLPVTKPEELWRVGDKIRCCNWGGYTQDNDGDFALFSWEAYRNFREHTPEFSDLAALQAGNANLGVRRAGSRAPVDTRNGEYVSGNFFRTLGIQPWIGRLMTDDDDREGAAPVAVMSYHIWTDKYGSDPSVVGAGYQINGHAFTVIGVAPPGFFGAKLGGGTPDLWIPVNTESLLAGESQRLKRPNQNWLDILGRVRPGVNPRMLEAKLRVEFLDWLASHESDMEPQEKQTWRQQTLPLIPGGAGVTAMRDRYEAGLKFLLIAAGCVLLVACGNLANLMLARGLKDRSQTSLRVALGASRGRLVRKALVESTLLAIIGGILGIGVAYGGSKLILYLAFHTSSGPQNYVPVDASPSGPVLLFTFVISILTGILFGIAPAWMASHVDPAEALRGSNRSVRGGGSIAQKSLVIAQAAASLVLLSAAALLGQSLRNLEHQNFGFETEARYLVSINPSLANYKPEQMEPLYRRIDERLLRIPGVRMVAPALYAPMSGDSWNEGIRIAGRPEPGPKEESGAGWARVMPGFFETLAVKIVQGRSFEEQDTPATRPVAVVNEAFVRRFFKDQNPIGQHFGMNRIQYARSFEIVGVVRDMRYMTWGYKEPIRPMFWLPETQSLKYDDPQFTTFDLDSHFLNNIVVWAPGNPPGMEVEVRKALASIDPNLVVYSVNLYSDILASDFQQESMIASLTSLFGMLGLVLAAVGLYGVMAYSVEQRTSEIGVRMALGADRGRVVRMVLRGAFLQIGIGLGIGIPLAIAAGRLMTEQLYGVAPWDPRMLTIATLLPCAAALLASWIPALRAASVEPIVALRAD